MALITSEALREKVRYDPDTGLFYWLVSPNQKRAIGQVGGSMTGHGYIGIMVNQRKYQAHRLAWFYMTGEHPKHAIDHIDGVRTNNRFSNLREATVAQNRYNTKPTPKASGLPRGIFRMKNGAEFAARIGHKGVQHDLGRFESVELANEFYELAAELLHGEFAYHLCAGRAKQTQGQTI